MKVGQEKCQTSGFCGSGCSKGRPKRVLLRHLWGCGASTERGESHGSGVHDREEEREVPVEMRGTAASYTVKVGQGGSHQESHGCLQSLDC